MKPHLLLFALPALLLAADRPKTVLYGAAYYHEYQPYDRLDKDIALMKQAGITVVRVGESTWTSWEPRDGDFQYAWMDRIVDAMHAAGIKVIMGTPTYSIPPWMYKKHPEMLVFHYGVAPPMSDPWYGTYPDHVAGGAYGPRQNMDLTNPDYRRYSERVIRKIAQRYAKHPAVIGWQIDNETAPNGLPLPNVQKAFLERVKEKFGTTRRMNDAWGLVYWGQLVDSWDDFPARDGILNPGYKLEWERFQQSIVTEFLGWQARIVREYARPDQFVTQDFVGGVRTNVDQWSISRDLDVASTNIYHSSQDKLDGVAIAMGGDLARSLKQQYYYVTETNAQGIGWDSRGQFPPYDGQLRLSAWAHVASGASMVEYWHWHSLHYGQETYWRGLLGHDLEPNRVYREAMKIGEEFKRVGPRVADLSKDVKVAVLFSNDSFHGLSYMPVSDAVNYATVMQQMYSALFNLNVEADFVTPATTDLSRYKVLIVPPLYVASDETLERISKFVENGGHVVMAFKSGYTNEYDTVRWQRAPGPLRKAAGFSYQEFSSLAHPVNLKPDRYQLGANNQASAWAEFLTPETAETLASYDHPFFGRFPALTRNKFGKGTLTYEGTAITTELQQAVIRDVIERAGLAGADQRAPEGVRIRHGRNPRGSAIHFYLNFSPASKSVNYAYGNGNELLSGKPAVRGAALTLAPWDVMVVEETR